MNKEEYSKTFLGVLNNEYRSYLGNVEDFSGFEIGGSLKILNLESKDFNFYIIKSNILYSEKKENFEVN